MCVILHRSAIGCAWSDPSNPSPATIAILFTLLIVSRETAPALGSWGTLAVLVTTALPGAFVGSRFRFAARACVGLLGA